MLDEFEQDLLDTWEEVYKRGLITLWILLALQESSKYSLPITKFINEHTNDSLKIEDQSLYRALRRLKKMRLVNYIEKDAGQGRDRKVYSITESGQNVLSSFLKRNINQIYYKESVKKLLNKGVMSED